MVYVFFSPFYASQFLCARNQQALIDHQNNTGGLGYLKFLAPPEDPALDRRQDESAGQTTALCVGGPEDVWPIRRPAYHDPDYYYDSSG